MKAKMNGRKVWLLTAMFLMVITLLTAGSFAVFAEQPDQRGCLCVPVYPVTKRFSPISHVCKGVPAPVSRKDVY